MTSIRALLGFFPNTENYESKQDQLRAEYQRLSDIEKSEDLKRFKYLESHLSSNEFLAQKKELIGIRFKNSSEYNLEREYQHLSKRKDVKNYFATNDSQGLKDYLHTAESKELLQFQELEEFIHSDAFKAAKAHCALKPIEKFKRSDLYTTFEQYQHLSKHRDIVAYQKFTGHKLYANFEVVDRSAKLKEYEELKTKVESDEFQQQLASIPKKERKASEVYRDLQKFKNLTKDKSIKNYFKLKNSPIYKGYIEAKDSEELVVYEDLKAFITSDDFKSQRNTIEKKKFTDTPEFQQLESYKKLAAQPNIKHYFKFGASKELDNYHRVKNSSDLKRFQDLKEEVESDDFQKRKAYMQLGGKQRWEQSEGAALEKEFAQLSSSADIKWYKKHCGHKRFQWFNNWRLTFEDHFSNSKVNSEKWISKYYYGEKLLNSSYSLDSEYALLSDGKNLELSNNVLQIITRSEPTNGMAWSEEFGFVPRKFEYTSGIISSGGSFWQKYGTIEAKVCVSNTREVTQACWLVANAKIPHIDVLKASQRISFGLNTTENGSVTGFEKKLSRGKFAGKFFIYSMEWLPGKIEWRINGIPVASTNQSVPDTAMYLNLSSHIFKEISNENLPDSMQVDWVRCYQHTEYAEDPK